MSGDVSKEMAAYIRAQRDHFSDDVIRDRLEKDGMSHAAIEAGFTEAGPLEPPTLSLSVRGVGPGWRKWGVGALIGALLAGGYLVVKSKEKQPEFKSRTGPAAGAADAP